MNFAQGKESEEDKEILPRVTSSEGVSIVFLTCLPFFIYWRLSQFSENIDKNWLFYAHPGEMKGLISMFFSQFSHREWGHFEGNMKIFILQIFVLAFATRNFRSIVLALVVTTGLLNWYFAVTNSLGTSSLIFAIFGYLCISTFLNPEISLSILRSHRDGNLSNFWDCVTTKAMLAILNLLIMYLYWNSISSGMQVYSFSTTSINGFMNLMQLATDTVAGNEVTHHPLVWKTPDGMVISRWGHLRGFGAGVIVCVLHFGWQVRRFNPT